MVNSTVLAASERNIRRTIYGSQNRSEYWGGLPVVILFGDDYQLPPVSALGAITGYGLHKSWIENRHSFKIYIG